MSSKTDQAKSHIRGVKIILVKNQNDDKIFIKMNMMIEDEFYQVQSTLFKALNHPVRLAILDVLRQDEACVCHLEAVLGQRQAYISQQLSVLREAKLIQDRRDGWNIYYQVTDRKIFDLVDLARQVVFKAQIPVINLKPQNCPCPKCNANQDNFQTNASIEKKFCHKEKNVSD